MHIHNLSNINSIINNFIFEIRDVSIQNDSMRFRRNIERIGEVLSYEMSKTLHYNRHHLNDKDFEIVVEYIASPNLQDKTLLLVDPMLASGKSLALTYEALKSHGNPKEIHILSVIGAEAGIDYVKDVFPENTHLWIATIDKTLNDKGYIVPGLGDAGDLAFGNKLRH